MSAPTASTASFRAGAALIGVALLTGFAALPSLSDGMRVVFRPPWDHLSPEEAWFWLATAFLLLPGCVALGFAVQPWLDLAWERVARSIASLGERERWQVAVLVAVVATGGAQLLNALVLEGLPVTDDEFSTQVGGRLLAAGALTAPVPAWFPAGPQLFLYARHGAYTSFDFPGALGAWALSELTSTGTWVFSALAGLGLFGLVVAAGRRWGPTTGAIALLLGLASPHFVLVSMSSHTHVLSRGFLGAALALLWGVERPGPGRGLAGGVLLGLAGLCRPLETAALVSPWLAGVLVDSVRARRGPFVAALVLGSGAFVALFAWYDVTVSGSALPLRLQPNDVVHPYGALMRPALDFSSWPRRLGGNVMYNFMMSGVFLLGPVGLPLAALGARVDSAHRRLALGAVLCLLLALLHDDRGIHAVGPIHLTEASLALLLLATAGVRRLVDWCRGLRLPVSAGAPAGYLAGLVVFTAGYAQAHADQASVQRAVYALIDSAGAPPSVVLAPLYDEVSSTLDERRTGSWVFSWRRVDPTLAEPVIVLHDSPEARANVGAWFQERRALVLELRDRTWTLVPLAQAKPLRHQGVWTPLVPR